MTVADRIAVMNHGVLVQVAPPSEIYEQPATRYVADFIGEVNLIEGTVSSAGADETRLSSPITPFPLNVAQGVGAKPGDKACLAIRPEKLRISLTQPADISENCFTGEIWDIGYLGDLSIYHVELPCGTRIKVSQPNLSRVVERPISWEDKVWVTFAPHAGVLLTR